MKHQLIYDTVARHLLTQKEQAFQYDEFGNRSTICAYRDPHGFKCAIGALMPDHLYQKKVEKEALSGYLTLSCIDPIYELPNELRSDDYNFLASLQRLHDDSEPTEWFTGLQIFAKVYDLDDSVLKEFDGGN